MSRPTREDLRLMDRLERVVWRFGSNKSTMGCHRRDFFFDRYVARRWDGRTSLIFLGWADPKTVFTWDHTTKEVEVKEEIHLPGLIDELDRLLVLEDLADA